jgi:hypothetical protein
MQSWPSCRLRHDDAHWIAVGSSLELRRSQTGSRMALSVVMSPAAVARCAGRFAHRGKRWSLFSLRMPRPAPEIVSSAIGANLKHDPGAAILARLYKSVEPDSALTHVGQQDGPANMVVVKKFGLEYRSIRIPNWFSRLDAYVAAIFRKGCAYLGKPFDDSPTPPSPYEKQEFTAQYTLVRYSVSNRLASVMESLYLTGASYLRHHPYGTIPREGKSK